MHAFAICQAIQANLSSRGRAAGCRLVRRREHDFSVAVVQTVRSTYKRGFLSTLKGKNKEQQRALKQQRDVYEGRLSTAREAALVAEERARADTSRAHREAAAFRQKVCNNRL